MVRESAKMKWNRTMCILGAVLLCMGTVTAGDESALAPDTGVVAPVKVVPADMENHPSLSAAMIEPAQEKDKGQGSRDGECDSGGCTDTCAPYPGSLFTTTSADWTSFVSCAYAGEYSRFSVVSGETYEWSSCTGDGDASCLWDSQFMLRDTYDTNICFSDDFCGLQSKITWTATFTGEVWLARMEYNCQTNSTCANLVWRCASCGGSTPPNDACADAESIAVGDNVQGNTANATNDGTPTCVTSAPGKGVWYVVTGTGNTITASLCNAYTDFDTKIQVWCDCTWTECVAGNDDFCGTQSEVSWCSLAGHDYYILVGGYSSYSGNFQLDVTDDGTACGDPACAGCDIECDPGDTLEGEPVCGDEYDDAFNGGCNSTPPVFSSIACGETVCGTSGTFLFGGGNYRDTDWYAITTTVDTIFTWTAEAEFPVLLFAIAANSGDCVDYELLDSITAGPCELISLTSGCLPAGTYWLFVAPSVFTGVPCGAEYRATLTCVECGVPPCEPDFTVTAPGIWAGNTTGAGDDCDVTGGDGDDHIYEVTIPNDGEWVFSLCNSTYDTKLAIGTTCCSEDIGYNDDAACAKGRALQSEVTATITAGTYFVTVDGYNGATGDYELYIFWNQPCVVECPAGGTPEGEPVCADEYDDVFNGGCSPAVPVYSPIACGETVCGTSGTFLFGGSNYRDTDWYEIVLTEWTELVWTAQAEFPVLIFIIDAGSSDCVDYEILASAVAAECDTVSLTECVRPGTYWLWVGPSVFEGIPCGADYWVSVECSPCDPSYCAASGGCDEYIERVEVGGIDNTTGCDGYGNYTAQATTMEVGGSYPINITIGNAYSTDVGGLWIDWNHDYDFDDAGESITLTDSPGYGPYTATITPPWGAALGDTMMRVRVQYGGTPEPCGTTTYGDVEDYTITVVPGPTALTLVPGDTCLENGVDTLTVEIVLTSGASEEIVGGGFYLDYDETILDLDWVDPVTTPNALTPGDAPFTLEVHEVVDEGNGFIDYATGIPETEPTGYMGVGPITMARIHFTVLVENCDLAGAVTFRDPGFPFETRLAKAVPGGGSAPLVPDDLLGLTNISIDWQAPVLTVPADVSVQCIEDADPGLLYGVATGGIAIYYNNNGLGENPANQAYLKSQYSATNLNGSEFHFDATPLTGIPGTSFNDFYSGLTPPATQFGYDIVLPAPTADGTVIPLPVIAYDYDGSGPSNPMPVVWAVNDYKPGGAANPAAIVYNSIVRSPSPGDIATDVFITRLDWENSGPIYTSNIAGVLVSDGIHHWYTPSTPDSPMSNFGLGGVFYFSGTLTYDSSSDPDPLMDFYAGDVTVVANYRSSEAGFATAVDNCTLFPVIAYTDVIGGGTGCLGDPITITRTWTATDDCGNVSTADQIITVEDTTPPEFVACPEDITVNNDPDLCSAVVSWTPPQAWDNCDGYLTPTASHAPGDAFLVGTTTVTYDALDSCGNSSVCSFDVTVIDNEPPVVACPSNITEDNDLGVCEASVMFAATATDNCSYTIKYEIESDPIGAPGVFDFEITSPYTFPVGTTTVLVTATDPAGLTDTCTFTVTINDAEAPVISGCPADITVDNDPGVCEAVVTWTAPTAMDNCDGALTPAGTHNPGDTFPVGVTTVTYTVSDAAGNPAIPCVFTVTVLDAEAPVISGCPSDITVNNDAGLCSAVVTWTAPTAWDNCDGALTPAGTHNPGDTFPVGVTTVTYTVSDAAGNPAIPCVFTVTVIDNELPTIACPADVTVNADPGVCYATGVDLGTPMVGDNCGIEPGYPINDAPAQFPAGPTIVTWTVRDVNGNENTCQQTVTVLGYNDLVVDIEIQGGFYDADPGNPGDVLTLVRCIVFTFFDCDGTDYTFERDITFTSTDGANCLATNVVIGDQLACGDYDCVTAQDRLHTLTVRLDRGAGLDIVGDHYEAYFTGSNMLLQGDYYDDFVDGYPVDFIDIVDFGVYIGQWGSVYDSDGDLIPDGDTPCGVFTIHADANGDGVIDVSDFGFIADNYGTVGDEDCCSPSPGTPEPRTSITVRELAALGVPDAYRSDLNDDGVIDLDDVALFLNGVVPEDDTTDISSENTRPKESRDLNSRSVRSSRR